MVADIIIEVHNTLTGVKEKASKWNTYWDENGKLQGNQGYLVVGYRIEMRNNYDK